MTLATRPRVGVTWSLAAGISSVLTSICDFQELISQRRGLPVEGRSRLRSRIVRELLSESTGTDVVPGVLGIRPDSVSAKNRYRTPQRYVLDADVVDHVTRTAYDVGIPVERFVEGVLAVNLPRVLADTAMAHVVTSMTLANLADNSAIKGEIR